LKQKTLPFVLPLVMGVFGAVLGLAVGIMMWAFYACIDLIWYGLPHTLHIPEFHPVLVLTLTLLGGLLVGLCQRFMGNYPVRMEKAIKTFRETGQFDYKHIPQGLTTSFVSLTFGGSLGPEAAIVAIAGGSATSFSRWVKSMLIRYHLVDITGPDESLPQGLKRPAYIAGWIAGIAMFSVLAVRIFSGGMLGEFAYSFRGIDLLMVVPAGLIGGLGGVLYLSGGKILSNWLHDIDPLILALVSGLALGIAAIVFPEVLFSGSSDLPLLLNTGYAWYVVLLMGLSKILITTLLLSSGWKGGQFLPVMFSGSALGFGLSMLIPAIPPVVGAVGGMTAMTAVTMGNPLLAMLVVLLMVQDLSVVGTVIVAALVGYGIVQLYEWFAVDEPAQPEVVILTTRHPA
jgi:H+/Cl- antiporter ClcA